VLQKLIGFTRLRGCGWPFIRTLRHDSRTAHLPLVVLASADVIRDVEEAALGVAAVFVTPLLPNKLLETLQSLRPSRAVT